MYQKLFILATIALSAVNAHPGTHVVANAATAPDTTFKFSETFPESGVIPTAKPEWLELIKNVEIANAPVYKVEEGLGPQPEVPGQDPHCDWSFTGCLAKDDLYKCPKGQWALTYDDGPSEFSPKLYDYLDEVNAKVTFFMVGGQVVRFPDYTLRAFKAGHELAMHTWSHSYMTSLTNEQIVAELKWNELAIKEVTGFSPRLFRPPYGDIDNRVRDVAAALGFVPVIWNFDTNDWSYSSNPEGYPQSWIEGNVTKWANDAATATDGGVSLQHDLYDLTVNLAIDILPILDKAYDLVPVGACNSVEVYKEGNSTTDQPSASSASSASPSISSSSSSITEESSASMVAVSSIGLGIAALVAVALL